VFDLHYYDELGNQTEEYRLTVDISGKQKKIKDEDDGTCLEKHSAWN
jgi:hypothetical protein